MIKAHSSLESVKNLRVTMVNQGHCQWSNATIASVAIRSYWNATDWRSWSRIHLCYCYLLKALRALHSCYEASGRLWSKIVTRLNVDVGGCLPYLWWLVERDHPLSDCYEPIRIIMIAFAISADSLTPLLLLGISLQSMKTLIGLTYFEI